MHSYMLKQLFSRKTLSIMREPVHTHIFQKKKKLAFLATWSCIVDSFDSEKQ